MCYLGEVDFIAVQLQAIFAAYEAILAAIKDRRLRPGEILTEEELAERLQVSRRYVKYAAMSLEKEGAIERIGGSLIITADRRNSPTSLV